MLLIIFVNLLDQLLIFYIVWIPRTTAIFNMRPNKCFYTDSALV